MLPQEIIRAKCQRRLTDAEIAAFTGGLCDEGWSDAQVAALAMAIRLLGMDAPETASLTRAMAASGLRLDWSDLPGPVVDKHSTGGIGDKVSLILAPALAACGCFVPMLSGRGLGHTGGTLDKLDAIPGVRSMVAPDILRQTVRAAGCAIVGATDDLAPADRRLYAIRDMTATVESVPLITASILAKKLAAGPGHLVMDVKYGSGAFMADPAGARTLARSLVDVATAAGLPTRALLSDMNMCLGKCAGNALEVHEAIAVLTGKLATGRLYELTLALGSELLDMVAIAEGRDRLVDALASGRAAERFARMIALLGGPADLLERPDAHLAAAPLVRPVLADAPGFIASIDARALGMAVITLGGGRRTAGQVIDHAVGLGDVREVGAAVAPDSPLAVIHARDETALAKAAAAVRGAFWITAARPEPGPLILERLTSAQAAPIM